MGLIWHLVEMDLQEMFMHTGRITGINTSVFLQRDEKLGVIVLITKEFKSKELFIEIMI